MIHLRLLKRTVLKLLLMALYLLFASNSYAAMDLKALLEYGLEHSPSLKSSKNTQKINKLAVSNSISNFLPSLDVSATHGYKDGDPTGPSNPWAGEFSLTLSEKLYDNGSNLIGYDIAKLKENKSNIEYNRDRGEFCLSVVKEYNMFSQAVELLEVQRFQYNLITKQFKSIESKYQRGEKTRTEYLRFKARLQRSSLTLKIAENVVAKSTEELKVLLGWTGGQLDVQPHKSTDNVVDDNLVETPDLKSHYEYRIADLKKRINNKNVRFVEKKYFPEIYITADATYTNTDYLSGSGALADYGQLDWSALIKLKYNLWDWGIRKRNFAIAKLERDSGNNSIDRELLVLKARVSKLVLDINQLKENLRLNQELVQLERKNYSSLERDYRNGRAAFLDLVNSVDNLTNAQDLFYRTYFELNSLLAEYKFHQGKLYESIFNR